MVRFSFPPEHPAFANAPAPPALSRSCRDARPGRLRKAPRQTVRKAGGWIINQSIRVPTAPEDRTTYEKLDRGANHRGGTEGASSTSSDGVLLGTHGRHSGLTEHRPIIPGIVVQVAQ